MNESHISSQKLDLNPCPIHDKYSEQKSQEGILAGIGIFIGAFFALGILSALTDSIISTIKFNKAYKQLSEEQKQKLKVVLKETSECMLNNCKTQTELVFKKFKSRITADKSKLEKLNLKLIQDTIKYNVYERGNKNTDKITKHSIDLLYYCNAFGYCSAEIKMLENYGSIADDIFDYTSELDDFMKASNIDDESEKQNFSVKNIGNNSILKSIGYYSIYESHREHDKTETYDIHYDIIFNFPIDKAKAKKEIGFFLDILKKV